MWIIVSLLIGDIRSPPDYGVAKKFQNCHTKFVTTELAEISSPRGMAAYNIANAWGETI